MSSTTVPDLTDSLAPLLASITDALHQRVNHDLPPGHVDETTTLIVDGLETVIDYCCPGLAWVRVVRTYPSMSFPSQFTGVGCPPPSWAAVIELGISRCACTPDDDGNMDLSCLQEQATQFGLDRAALIQTVMCDVCGTILDCDDVVAGQWTPLAIQGGCGGGTIEVTISYDQCCDDISS